MSKNPASTQHQDCGELRARALDKSILPGPLDPSREAEPLGEEAVEAVEVDLGTKIELRINTIIVRIHTGFLERGGLNRERESRLLNPPPGSTDPGRFATVSIGIGDRVLFHPAPRVGHSFFVSRFRVGRGSFQARVRPEAPPRPLG